MTVRCTSLQPGYLLPMTTAFVLPDLESVPEIGSRERDAHEEAALARARELLHEEEGSIRDALHTLEMELRGDAAERATRQAVDVARVYARKLVSHVEQCWATAVLR